MKIKFPKLLIPNNIQHLNSWHVMACDQFVHDDSYWNNIELRSIDNFSTYHLIIPENELYRDELRIESRLSNLRSNMVNYYNLKNYQEIERDVVIVTRQINGVSRLGVLILIDLEDYSFSTFEDSKFRATEKTKENRLKLREDIREISLLELSHAIVLYDHEDTSFLKNILSKGEHIEKLYSLVLSDGDKLIAYKYSMTEKVEGFFDFKNSGLKYDYMLVGDGNHSIAAAKHHWEKLKKDISILDIEKKEYRYYFAEAININDLGLEFHPIHRFAKIDSSLLSEFITEFGKFFEDLNSYSQNYIDLTNFHPYDTYINLDVLLKKYSIEITYPHLVGEIKINFADKCCFFFEMPRINKSDLFDLIKLKGILPKKSFSVGYPNEKRYYVEMRKLK